MYMWFYYKRFPHREEKSFKLKPVHNDEPQEIRTTEEPIIHSKKGVDFALVYKNKLEDKSYNKIENFLENLHHIGFQLESSPFSVNPEINFIKIRAPTGLLLRYAEAFGRELAFRTVQYKIRPSKPSKCMATILTRPDISHPVFQRAKEVVLGITPETITSAERGLIIYKILSRIRFGENGNEFGVQNLLKKKILNAAYPVHDGPSEWTNDGPLNDRQLLAKYWSTIKCWHKQQPLDLVEKYFGPEAGLYFAWLGFYNRMLIPLAIISIVIFLSGIPYHQLHFLRSKEICESDLLLCPRCIVSNCKFERLKKSCHHAILMHLIDNPLVIAFAALTSVWSCFCMELWRRKEAMLQIRWNLKSVEDDYSMRPDYQEKATRYKRSRISGSMEPYMPRRQLCCRYTFTVSVILLLLTLMILCLIAIVIYVRAVSTIFIEMGVQVGVMAPILSSILSVCLIVIVDDVYKALAMWLTKIENHRTQVEFNNAFIYKCYALAFVNNYCVIIYLAFFKARFYTYPGDEAIWKNVGGINSMTCAPGGCIYDLAIQLIVILFGKNLFRTLKQFVLPQIYICRQRKKFRDAVKAQWEHDYLLNPITEHFVIGEYIQMVIQYGFVVCFVAAFPPAPFLALLNNVLELRVDAFKLTNAFRRPIAFKIPNLAAWKGILEGITYLGIAANAFVIAFTSEFVPRTIYKIKVAPNLNGYVKNYLLSVYSVNEFPSSFQIDRNISTCYYPGNRYPPDHPQKYQLTDDFWFILAIRFLVVVIFEHALGIITGTIVFLIPNIPFKVKQHINVQKGRLKEIKHKSSLDYVMKNHGHGRVDISKEL